jgi:hypothetical protein
MAFVQAQSAFCIHNGVVDALLDGFVENFLGQQLKRQHALLWKVVYFDGVTYLRGLYKDV